MWQWVGNTLNPYYEGHSMSTAVFDDRFILPTYPCWDFGPNNTGDIMDPGFLDSLMEQVQANGPFHLVTADGSVDCQNLPDQQETLVAGLHFAEVVIALHCLAPNGNLVVKKFTLLECDSVCLTFLLTCLFNKVNVFKPVTSKPGNSEVYVICQGFRATEATMILPILRENLRGNPKALFCRQSIPEEFLQELRSCGEKFVGFQQEAIMENLKLYQSQEDFGWLHSDKSACVTRYFQLCGLEMPPQLPSHVTDRSRMPLHPGSYNARQEATNLWLVNQNFLNYFSKYLVLRDRFPSPWHDLQPFKSPLEPSPSWVLMGKPLDRILSSKFCCPRLLYLWSQVRDSGIPLIPLGGTLKDLEHMLQSKGRVAVIMKEEDPIEMKVEPGAKPTLKLFVAVLPPEEEVTEHFKRVLLRHVLQVLTNAESGDAATFCMPMVLSRYTVGLMFLLATSFHQLRVIPDPDGKFQMWHMDLFKEPVPHYVTFLNHLHGLPELRPVLEVVPVQLLAKFEGITRTEPPVTSPVVKMFYPLLISINRQQFVNHIWEVLQDHLFTGEQ